MTEYQMLDAPQSDTGNAAPAAEQRAATRIVPLRDTVIFPNTTVGFTLQDDTLATVVKKAHADSQSVLLLPLLDGANMADQVGAVVTRAQIIRLNPAGGGLNVLVQGTGRERLTVVCGSETNATGETEPLTLSSPQASDAYWQAAYRNLRDAAVQLVQRTPTLPDDIEQVVAQMDDAELLTDLLSANLDLDAAEQHRLLNMRNLTTRVERLQQHLDNQLNIATLQEKLRADVKTEFSDAQRRMYLREQLRAIKKELGEDEEGDDRVAALRERLSAARLPDAVAETVDRDLSRLERIPPASPDYSGTIDYLETVADLPWSTLSEEDIDLQAAEQALDADHFGLQKVKRRLLEYLAVRKLNPNGRGPILCLVGPPGVGKTSLGQSIAKALGRKFARVALGGVRDEAEIRGHRRTYVGAMLGRIMQEIKRAGTRNPVIMLDEIDKMGADFRGDPASALLELLDPAQNHTFTDHYLNLPFDLSQVVFVTTANVLDTIPAALRDRMEIVRLSGYTALEKRAIAQRHLIPRQLETNGLTEEQISWTTEAVDAVIAQYTREAGVRLLEQKLGAVIRAKAARFARGEAEPVTIDVAAVGDALGPSERIALQPSLDDRVGVVNGLAYTPAGGDVLPIEAVRYAGKGQLTITGQLGSVMQESAQAAQSLVKARAKALGIRDALSELDTHLHVPDGAIPKDGPSAGAAMFLALASLYTDRAVRGDVAMTGEINLRGEVQPIGGLPEKTLAALAAGIHTVLIPQGNEKDIPTLPEEVRDSINIKPVGSVEEVLEYALTP